MKIFVFNQQKDLAILAGSVKSVVKEVLQKEGCKTDEITIYFVTTDEICRLHQEFFNDPSPTDCISFPMDDQQETVYHVLGEIFICPKTAENYLLSLSEELTDNVYQETTLYLVHGLLHLLGYDDIDEVDDKKMRQAEKTHMENLIEKKLLLKRA